MILSEDGLIITNAHVLGDPTDETDIRIVFSDGEEISGKDIKPVATRTSSTCRSSRLTQAN